MCMTVVVATVVRAISFCSRDRPVLAGTSEPTKIVLFGVNTRVDVSALVVSGIGDDVNYLPHPAPRPVCCTFPTL